jgi:uracil phosphoribosyltransferase
MSAHVTVVEHPLVQHKLSLMRDKDTPTAVFRQLLREISHLLAYEVTRDLAMTTRRIETPMQTMDAPVLEGKKLALVSILRAGNGLLDGVLELIPSARVGFVGLYRDHDTLQPVQYYFKVPADLDQRKVIAVDPMLCSKRRARQTSISSAFSRPPKASKPCRPPTRMCPSLRQPSTISSTILATSCPVWAMRATGCMAQNNQAQRAILPSLHARSLTLFVHIGGRKDI